MRRMIPLSDLSAGRRNPRRVRCERDAHRRLVASIRSVGLIQPLVVRPVNGDPDEGYTVVAGRRRLDALRAIHRGAEGVPLIKCEVESVDDATADTMALAENFAREGMHPLDEAEAFAKLADSENKGIAAVAAEFGVTPRYVRQRMKLAGLADPIKDAYRAGEIDTGTAEVLSGVPAARQMEAWEESGGRIRHANHARNLIECRWIDAGLALFDREAVPDTAVSHDLFGDRVLIERSVFMQAQAEAVEAEAERLREDGWGEVIVAEREDVNDRLRGMDTPGPDFDEPTLAKLHEVSEQRQALEASLEAVAEDDEEAIEALYDRLDALDEQEEAILRRADPVYSEPVKAVGTVFLLLDPDGRVHHEYRTPRQGRGGGQSVAVKGHTRQTPPPPTCEDLSERQCKEVLAQETVALRSVLLGEGEQAARTRRVLLALMLLGNASVGGGGLLTRREPDPIERYAEVQGSNDNPFASEAWEGLSAQRSELDPLHDEDAIYRESVEVYRQIEALPGEQLDRLIDLLIVQSVAGPLHHRNDLIAVLVETLGVELRAFWTPDAAWFAGYRKIQLADLLGKLRGTAYGHAAVRMKKSQLVESVTAMFALAREDKLNDPALEQRVNAWLPSCVRPEPVSEDVEAKSAA